MGPRSFIDLPTCCIARTASRPMATMRSAVRSSASRSRWHWAVCHSRRGGASKGGAGCLTTAWAVHVNHGLSPAVFHFIDPISFSPTKTRESGDTEILTDSLLPISTIKISGASFFDSTFFTVTVMVLHGVSVQTFKPTGCTPTSPFPISNQPQPVHLSSLGRDSSSNSLAAMIDVSPFENVGDVEFHNSSISILLNASKAACADNFTRFCALT
jgi:hypothetical protein